ncbi:MAG: hypothetical protein HGA96_01310 [Desulfobulbaceae bacterium]|nr:hypothetical protein [Desulfobulbaceae bacterium]
MSEKICYCFDYTVADIEADVRIHGESRLMAAILASKKAGGCRCATENPKGR